jgi:hypothetical protein
MNAFRLLITLLALAIAGVALGQSGERGSVPPGQSRDGSGPADGAIKGGAILPGESAGMPEKQRCEELSGTLREDCLKREREAGAGATGLPGDPRRPSDTRKKSPAPKD